MIPSLFRTGLVIVSLSAAVYANEQPGGQATAQAADIGAPAPATPAKAGQENDGYKLEKGKLYSVKAGKKAEVKEAVQLPDGTALRTDGTVIFKDGAGVKLEEGQMLSMSGQVVSAGDKTTPGGATSTSTDQPALGTPQSAPAGKTTAVEPNKSSPTGATRNMAPTREVPGQTSSASGLTTPGATSGSSLGSGSNSTTGKDTSKPSGATK